MTGQTIAHYRVVDKLGEGGMAIVNEAEDTERPSRQPRRFLREAQAAASLNHPNITEYKIRSWRKFVDYTIY